MSAARSRIGSASTGAHQQAKHDDGSGPARNAAPGPDTPVHNRAAQTCRGAKESAAPSAIGTARESAKGMKYVAYQPPENKRAKGMRLFVGCDGRMRIRYPGRGGWRFASPAEVAALPWPLVAVRGFRGDE